ncbi:putative amidase domain protein [Peptococcaceae bacterium CEB3]|nr:putative amidase domain protein [Peptococcaceae bacterium CEB3]
MKKMKKRIVKGSMLVLSVMLIMTFLVPVSLANVTSSRYSDLSAVEVTTIGGVLNNVLSSELNILKTGTAKDYSNVINDDKLLQLMQDTGKFKEEWYKDIDFKIYSYNSNVKMNNATKLSTNKYMLDVTFKAKLILAKDFRIHPEMLNHYVCEVEKKSGQWVIDKLVDKADYRDITQAKNATLVNNDNANILANSNMILDVKLNDLKKRLANIDNLAKSYKKIMQQSRKNLLSGHETAIPSYSGTNRQAIVNYATTYAMNHNPNYKYIKGADCTNFASQAVHAGGVPINTSYWYPGSPDWINVVDFCSYMVNNGYARESSLDRNDQNGVTDNISLGDVIQWRHSYWTYSHSTIATYESDTYGWLLSAHSHDRLNYPMSIYYSDFYSARDIYFW